MVSVRSSRVSRGDTAFAALTVTVWPETGTQKPLCGLTVDVDEEQIRRFKLRKVKEDKISCRKQMKTTRTQQFIKARQ